MQDGLHAWKSRERDGCPEAGSDRGRAESWQEGGTAQALPVCRWMRFKVLRGFGQAIPNYGIIGKRVAAQ